ncbi:hypothetical protein LMG7974_01774 [Campylobacter majalis]|uniref:Glycosyl transferase family 25 domain-containing protein n=1 Tax=Campylobacter majalis TaxID=2790656 RepID=A0ABM8QA08_9BACT|nr:glycosyltransferase family 25 protein [Campylobacter majalis]CAD7289696.1 hypothetical protein LMG7974_01774 [Campylobacter majalis]
MNNKIYLISLKKDTKRREILKSRFANYDDFELVYGVDGRELDAKAYYSHINTSFKAYGRLLTPSEVGCTLSHMIAYERFLQSGAEYALILEDDVIGDEAMINQAFLLAKNMDKNSVLICGCQDGLNDRFSAFAKRTQHMYEVSPYSYKCIYRTASYIITQNSAKAILNTHKNAINTTDVWEYLLDKNGLKMYFADIFSHPLDLSDSNIEKERAERGYKPNFMAYMRSIKFIIASRFFVNFCGYERIFKR